MELISKMNEFHQTLVQADDHEPAKGGKKDQDMSTLQGMIARLEGRVSQLQNSGASNSNGGNNGSCDGSGNGKKHKCFECGSEDHVVKDCPVRKQWQGTGGHQQSNNRRDVAG